LPEDLQELAYRNGVELTHARWKSDLQVLAQALEPYLNEGKDVVPEQRGLRRPVIRRLRIKRR